MAGEKCGLTVHVLVNT